MAAPVRTPPKPGGKSFLTRPSLGGMPMWVVLAGGAAALFLTYKLYENYKHGAASSATAPAAATDPNATDTSGGAGSTAADQTDLTPFEDLANSINGLTSVLGGGPFTIGTTGDSGTTPSSTPSSISDSNNTTTTTTTNNTTNYNTTKGTTAPTNAASFPVVPFTSTPLMQTASGAFVPSSEAYPVTPTIANAFKAATGVSVPTIPTPPTSEATKIKPVAGTTSNADAAKRSKSIH